MSSLIAWLRRDPRPFKLRLEGGQLMAYPPKATRGTKGLAELAESLEALAPAKLEALAEDGTILRVRLWESAEGEEEGTAKVIKGPSVADELLRILPAIATLFTEAADRGALRHKEAYDLAFTKQNELVTLVAARLQALETAWVKTINQSAAERIKFSEAIAEAQGSTQADPLDGMLANMFAQRMGGAQITPEQVAEAIQAYQAAELAKQAAAAKKPATNGASNGKAKGAKPS